MIFLESSLFTVIQPNREENMIHEASEVMKIDSSPFNDLPDEIILKIFKFLDGEFLKTSRLVAYHWNEVRSDQIREIFNNLMTI